MKGIGTILQQAKRPTGALGGRRQPMPYAVAVGCAVLSAACAKTSSLSIASHSTSKSAGAVQPAASSDPLGPRPAVPDPAAFIPAVPEVFAGPQGSSVWLFERHTLPLVSVAMVVPYGGSVEPVEANGLAKVASDMLDEGGGKRDAVAFSSALDGLGAQLVSTVDRDKSTVSLEVVESHLSEALELLADAIHRPRHDPKDFTRVSALWKNELQQRGDDPNEVARLVAPAAFFGLDHPYGRPLEGTLASVPKVTLAAVAKWHHTIWRPDKTTFVVVGDTTRVKITQQLGKAFEGWGSPKEPAPPITVPKRAAALPQLRTVVVDRPDAPQVVLSVVREGVMATDPNLPRLELMNIALGGSFTSRLNQDLREEHGWTYGVRSQFSVQRGTGLFVARAAIRTNAISDALGAMMQDIQRMGKEGLSAEEVKKIRAQARSELVNTYSSVQTLALRLANYAGLARTPDSDAKTIQSEMTASREDLNALAAKQLPLDSATLVFVGPRKAIEEALSAQHLPAPEVRDVEGKPVRKVSAGAASQNQ